MAAPEIEAGLAALLRSAASVGRMAGKAEYFRDDFVQRAARRIEHARASGAAIDDDLARALEQLEHMAPLLEELDSAMESMFSTVAKLTDSAFPKPE